MKNNNTFEIIQALPFFADKRVRRITPLASRADNNETYRIETEEGTYALRHLTRRETDRRMEYRAGRLAHAAGIAPEIVCFDPRQAMMVLEWIGGEHRTHLSREAIAAFARTLQKLHAIPYRDADLVQVDLRRVIDMDNQSVTDAFAVVEDFPLQPALCHHDLTPHNVLWIDDEPMLIDFEYAGIGDVCFDLAAVCVEFGLGPAMRAVLLRAYFGNTEACPRKKLAGWETLYRALRRQWLAKHGINQMP